MKAPDMLPTRLNFDAIVFCGCTMKEMQILVITSLISSVSLFGLLMKLLTGMFLLGVAFAFPITVFATWMGALILQRAKQGKPKGYLKQAYLLWKERHGLGKSPFTTRSGKWSTERYL